MNKETERAGLHEIPRPEAKSGEDAPPPFPIEFLPMAVRRMVQAVANSRSVAVHVSASLAVAACSSALRMTRVAYDEYADWTEPPILWMALSARSGTRKSVVISDLFAPHQRRQKLAAQAYEGETAVYEKDLERWTAESRKKKGGDPGEKPKAPKLQHVYTADPTPEALVGILKETSGGVLVLVDELAHLLGGFGAYTGKADRDRSLYLSMFRGDQFKSDRKKDGATFVESAAAWIVGGIQPQILADCFDPSAFSSGLVPRFLLVDSPPQVKKYRQGPTVEVREDYYRFVDQLFALKMQEVEGPGGQSSLRPVKVGLDPEARKLLKDFVPKWSMEAITSGAEVEAAMSKLEGYALRFALLFRVFREIEGEAVEGDMMCRQDLDRGIRLARWFVGRAVEVYRSLRGEPSDENRYLLQGRAAVIRDQFSGAATVNEWRRRNRRRSRAAAESELQELVDAGLAVWRERHRDARGGRPTLECSLLEPGPDGEDGDRCDRLEGDEQADLPPVESARLDVDGVSGIGYRVPAEGTGGEIAAYGAKSGGCATPPGGGRYPEPPRTSGGDDPGGDPGDGPVAGPVDRAARPQGPQGAAERPAAPCLGGADPSTDSSAKPRERASGVSSGSTDLTPATRYPKPETPPPASASRDAGSCRAEALPQTPGSADSGAPAASAPRARQVEPHLREDGSEGLDRGAQVRSGGAEVPDSDREAGCAAASRPARPAGGRNAARHRSDAARPIQRQAADADHGDGAVEGLLAALDCELVPPGSEEAAALDASVPLSASDFLSSTRGQAAERGPTASEEMRRDREAEQPRSLFEGEEHGDV